MSEDPDELEQFISINKSIIQTNLLKHFQDYDDLENDDLENEIKNVQINDYRAGGSYGRVYNMDFTKKNTKLYCCVKLSFYNEDGSDSENEMAYKNGENDIGPKVYYYGKLELTPLKTLSVIIMELYVMDCYKALLLAISNDIQPDVNYISTEMLKLIDKNVLINKKCCYDAKPGNYVINYPEDRKSGSPNEKFEMKMIDFDPYYCNNCNLSENTDDIIINKKIYKCLISLQLFFMTMESLFYIVKDTDTDTPAITKKKSIIKKSTIVELLDIYKSYFETFNSNKNTIIEILSSNKNVNVNVAYILLFYFNSYCKTGDIFISQDEKNIDFGNIDFGNIDSVKEIVNKYVNTVINIISEIRKYIETENAKNSQFGIPKNDIISYGQPDDNNIYSSKIKNELNLSSLESIKKHHNESANYLEKIFQPFLQKQKEKLKSRFGKKSSKRRSRKKKSKRKSKRNSKRKSKRNSKRKSKRKSIK